jgi:hypothetical protein
MGELTPACTKIEVISEQKKGVGTQTRWHSSVHPDDPTDEEIVDWRPLESLGWIGYNGDTPVMEGSLTITPTPEGYTILTFSEDFLITDVNLLKNEHEMLRELDSVKAYIEDLAKKPSS